MRMIEEKIVVDGQLTGPAVLHGYLLDNNKTAPEKCRSAIVVCAGGGYWQRSDRESEPIVTQFLAMGYHTFLMDYSVAPNHFPTSVRELGEAVARIREHAGEWNIDTARIIPCGFSAAGHLVCSLGVFWDQEFVWGPIGRKADEIRPDGMILCYPVITSGEFAHVNSFKRLLGEDASKEQKAAVSLENFVTEKTPPAFLWHTWEDESVPLENSLLLASALRRCGVHFELHVYPTGGHGLSLATSETAGENTTLINEQCQSWVGLLKTWLAHF